MARIRLVCLYSLFLSFSLFLGACGGSSGDTTESPPAGDGPVVVVLYVSTPGDGGSDANPGTSDQPLTTLTAAVTEGAAVLSGGNADAVHVYVSLGTYNVDSDALDGTHVVLSEGVSLFGGYPLDWSARDPLVHTTTIADGGTDTGNNVNPNRAVYAGSGITTATLVDGFIILGGSGDYTTGMYLAGSPTVQNSTIDGGGGGVTSTGVYVNGAAPLLDGNTITAGTGGQNYGVQVQNGGTPTFTANDIQGGAGNLSFALMTFNSAPIITGNTLDGGTATNSRGLQNSNGAPLVVGNTIRGGNGGTQTVAVLNTNASGTATLRNNVILGGTATTTTRGISIEGGSHPIVQHNTIDGGTAGTVAYGVVLVGGSGGTLQNNIIFTTSAPSRYCLSENAATDEPEVFENNALSGCPTALYHDDNGVTPVDATAVSTTVTAGVTTDTLANLGNVGNTPVFVGATDWHLHADTSAAVRKGGADLTTDVSTDKDGVARTSPVSMGAYEMDTGTFLAQAASGGTIALTGTWATGCYTSSGFDVNEVRVFSGDTITLTGYDYTSTDSSCSAGEAVSSGTGIISETGTVTAAGWTDVSTTQSPPTATGGGSLPATPPFTTGVFTGVYAGTPFTNEPIGGFYVDDTGTPWKLFRVNRNPFLPCSSTGDASGDELCLMTVDFLVKQ